LQYLPSLDLLDNKLIERKKKNGTIRAIPDDSGLPASGENNASMLGTVSDIPIQPPSEEVRSS
jgi:hypothetical protein